jgi:BirA family transcriptional regulator, biotin operon repressor / biotin---[acetyl-CoA-carboxylase] ligase
MTGKENYNKNEKIEQAQKENLAHLHPFNVVKHFHFEEIDSTNTWAILNANQWAAKGVTLVTASGQTAGRGRFKRRWESPSHVNIYATFCFWFDSERNDVGHIPQLLALTAAQTIEIEGFSPKIKWPNDLLLMGKKVGGILCETIWIEGKRGIACGIGLNVNMPQDTLNLIDRPATSLFVERGHEFDRASILEILKQTFTTSLEDFIVRGFSRFSPLLQKRTAFNKGDKVRFHDNQRFFEGHFEAIHSDGSVEVKLLDGTTKIYYAGEFLT